MVRDTVITIAGRQALVAAAHVATFRRKQQLVLKAHSLQNLISESGTANDSAELKKTMRSIQAINRKMKSESMFAEFV
jgi:hypothetical protein